MSVDGTAQIFEHETRMFTFSMHGDNNFPFRKEQSDLDIPLPDDMNGETYLSILSLTLPKLIDQQKPDFISYLSGVDVLATDKLGKLALTIDECKERDRIVLQLCKQNKIPVQISMDGGYSPNIKDIVEAHCNTFRLADEMFF